MNTQTYKQPIKNNIKHKCTIKTHNTTHPKRVTSGGWWQHRGGEFSGQRVAFQLALDQMHGKSKLVSVQLAHVASVTQVPEWCMRGVLAVFYVILISK